MAIYDSFLFFNELEILEIRLNTLYDVVDYFIISESTKTHTGMPKPLYYSENKNRFKKFNNKIIHQVVTDTPDYFVDLNNQFTGDYYHDLVLQKLIDHNYYPKDHLPYCRDAFEKESIIRAMSGLNDSDIIIFSDADEIPNPSTVENLYTTFAENTIYNFKHIHYNFYLNCMKEDNWIGNTALSFKNFKKESFCTLRKYRRGEFLDNAGWHFSFMGGADRVRTKVSSYGESLVNTDYIKNNTKEVLSKCIKNNLDLLGSPVKYNIIPVTCVTHPKYLVEHLEEYRDMLYEH